MTFAVLALLIWCWLLTLRGGFWRTGPILPVAVSVHAPPVGIIVPARDEAPLIERTIRSLLAQDYPGEFHITLVNDGSEDGTGAMVRAIDDDKLSVLEGAPRPTGWAGKMWALHQGVAASGQPEFFMLTDADIEHDSTHLRSMVAVADRYNLDMVSEMVALSCDSWAEKVLIPAFVFYFQLLYPFAWVNNPAAATAAAAGGAVLIRRRALSRIGGIEAVKGALIDDVALAGAVKAGGRIFLGHSMQARSIRPYSRVSDIWRMIARSAYAQLQFSPVLLAGAIAAMTLTWIVPPIAAFLGRGCTSGVGLLTWLLFSAVYLPTLVRFRRSPLWALFLPMIAVFYMTATIGSAVNHYRGRGVVWKGRAYAGGSP